MKNLSIILIILFQLFLFNKYTYPQSKDELIQFFQDNASLILSLAHKNSTLISAQVEVNESDDTEFMHKIVITMKYKGFVKNHTLKAFVYFEDYPRKFTWGKDTNSFKINTEPEVVLEELKDAWSKFRK